MSKIAQEMQRWVDERHGRSRREAAEPRKPVVKLRAPLKRTKLKASPRTAAKRQVQSKVVAAVRALVFAVDHACISGRYKPSATDEMHEIDSRAKTRGRNPEQRFSLENCVRLSRETHAETTGALGKGKTLTIEKTPGSPLGPFTLRWTDGRVVVYRRKDVR